MFGKKDDGGQVSETSQMTPEGGVDGTPGTEEGTPAAVDTQHAPHEGPRDYSKAPDPASGRADEVRKDGLTGTDDRHDRDDVRRDDARREPVREGEILEPEEHRGDAPRR